MGGGGGKVVGSGEGGLSSLQNSWLVIHFKTWFEVLFNSIQLDCGLKAQRVNASIIMFALVFH